MTVHLTCPHDTSPLQLQDKGYLCASCSRVYPINDGVVMFTEPGFYWGEIPQQDMRNLLKQIVDRGFASAMEWLAHTHPGRDRFALDPGRADWRVALDLQPGMRALDIGCGLGSMTFALADQGLEVCAVDTTFERVAFVEARRQAEHQDRVMTFLADAYTLPFAAASFDLIICNGLLEWIAVGHDEADPSTIQQRFLERLRLLLKPGGVLYIGIENRWALAYWRGGIDHSGWRYTSLVPRWLATAVLRIGGRGAYQTYTYGYDGYQKLFHRAGFNQVETYLPYPGYNNPVTLIPYEALLPLRNFLSSRKTMKRLPSWLQRVVSHPLMVRWYRRLSFSYCFYLR